MIEYLKEEDYFRNMRQRGYEPTPDVIDQSKYLLDKVNELLTTLNTPTTFVVINSGWRSRDYNATVPGAALNSKHIGGQAIDLGDPEGDLWDMITEDLLEDHGLYAEHRSATKGWVHLQTVPPRSGNRIFYP
jgi:uncharacterized protein YcbK (DUF882 family)